MNTNLISAESLPQPRMVVKNGLLIPKRVTIETIYGCNFHCPMCPIDMPSKRKKGLMSWELFEHIIDSLAPYKDNIEMIDLFSLGEPLLDKLLIQRIRYIKEKEFCSSIGISTNASLLTEKNQKQLLESKIDNVIFSIDGATKETYESIRVGGIFEKDIANCIAMIERRNQGNYQTRFLIRFIRQDKNRHEVKDFVRFWSNKIDRARRDFISIYDAHTFGGNTGNKDEIVSERNVEIEQVPCFVIFDILYILADGTVPLCNEDWLNGDYNFGNAKDTNPIEIFNSAEFKKVRELHLAGNKTQMEICKNCTVLYSEVTKQNV